MTFIHVTSFFKIVLSSLFRFRFSEDNLIFIQNHYHLELNILYLYCFNMFFLWPLIENALYIHSVSAETIINDIFSYSENVKR